MTEYVDIHPLVGPNVGAAQKTILEWNESAQHPTVNLALMPERTALMPHKSQIHIRSGRGRRQAVARDA